MIELLLAIGILIVISVVAISNLQGRRSKKDLDSAVAQVVATLREAQTKSVAQDSGVIWGVHFGNTTNTPAFYALFKTSYSAANTKGYYPLPGAVSYVTSSVAQGSSLDITFAQISGVPSTSTSIILQLNTLIAGGSTGVLGPANVSRSATGKIFFDDFNRSNL